MKSKFTIVTGASTGIGRAIAIEFGRRGDYIALVARRKVELEKTKRMVKEAGGKGNVFVVDLSNINAINKFISSVKKKTDRIDVLVNVAGIWHGKNEVYSDRDFETFPQKVILDTYRVGTIVPTLLAHSFVPLMPKNGKIINISGTFENGAKGWLPYYVSKKAIEDLTIGLAEELKDKKIQVNCISPSDTATKEYKKYFSKYIKEAIEPVKIAKYAVYLCSGQANDINGEVFVMQKGRKPYKSFHT